MSIELMAQYLDDRDSLNDDQMSALLTYLKANPDKAQELHELMQVDNSLHNQLSEHPSSLTHQVNQRLDDLSHPSKKIKTKNLVKRRLRRQRLEAKAKHSRIGVALIAIAAVVFAAVSLHLYDPEGPTTTYPSESGFVITSDQTTLERSGVAHTLTKGHTQTLMVGDIISTAAPAMVSSGQTTNIRVDAGSSLSLNEFQQPQTLKQELGLHINQGNIHVTVATGRKAQAGHAMLTFTTPTSLLRIQGTTFELSHHLSTSFVSLAEGSVLFGNGTGDTTLTLMPGESAIHHPTLGLAKSPTTQQLANIPPLAHFTLNQASTSGQRWKSESGKWTLTSPSTNQSPQLVKHEQGAFLRFDGKDDELFLLAPNWQGPHTIIIVARRHSPGPGQRTVVDGYKRGSLVGQFENDAIRQDESLLVNTDPTKWNINYLISKPQLPLGGLTVGSLGREGKVDWGREPGNVDVKALLIFKGKLNHHEIGAWMVHLKTKYPNAVMP